MARLDGEALRLSEVEGRAAQRIHRARLDVYTLLERETEELLEERLLVRAARARGVDSDTLLREAEATAATVGEAEVDSYLALHPGDAPAAKARPRIRHYLEETRRIDARHRYLEELRAAADIELLLEPPTRVRSTLDLRGAPSRGPEDAPITIVHFADLSAEDSARSARNLMALVRELPGRLRVVHRNHPVERDELGLRTAQLAAAAEARGVFWALHDRLVGNVGPLQAEELESAARELGLEDLLPELSGDRDTLLRVKQDLDRAREAGVQRAPSLFVNGRYFMGLYGEHALRELVLEELAVTRARLGES